METQFENAKTQFESAKTQFTGDLLAWTGRAMRSKKALILLISLEVNILTKIQLLFPWGLSCKVILTQYLMPLFTMVRRVSVNLTILANLGKNCHHSKSYELNQTCLWQGFILYVAEILAWPLIFSNCFPMIVMGNASLFTSASLHETKNVVNLNRLIYFFLS